MDHKNRNIVNDFEKWNRLWTHLTSLLWSLFVWKMTLILEHRPTYVCSVTLRCQQRVLVDCLYVFAGFCGLPLLLEERV